MDANEGLCGRTHASRQSPEVSLVRALGGEDDEDDDDNNRFCCCCCCSPVVSQSCVKEVLQALGVWGIWRRREDIEGLSNRV